MGAVYLSRIRRADAIGLISQCHLSLSGHRCELLNRGFCVGFFSKNSFLIFFACRHPFDFKRFCFCGSRFAIILVLLSCCNGS